MPNRPAMSAPVPIPIVMIETYMAVETRVLHAIGTSNPTFRSNVNSELRLESRMRSTISCVDVTLLCEMVNRETEQDCWLVGGAPSQPPTR